MNDLTKLNTILDEAIAKLNALRQKTVDEAQPDKFIFQEINAIDLLKEIMEMHANPEIAEYNECDLDQCCWCSNAEREIAKLEAMNGAGDE